MILLHIEHTVLNFENWKTSFDSFAALRQQSGVRSFRIARSVDHPNFTIIDLEFDTQNQAEVLLAAVQQVWQRTDGTLIQNPQWRLYEVVETKELQRQ
jgi:hypothetical protein